MSRYVLSESSARKLKGIFNGMISGSRAARGAETVDDSELLPPFSVRWAGSANNGEGAWCIWLPGDKLLYLDGEPVSLTEGLEEAGGDYPNGWYILSVMTAEGGELYLNITERTEEEDPSAVFASDEGEETTSILVAIATRASSGATSVYQFVDSAIIMGGGSCAVDEVSIDKLNKIELAHFKDGEKDSTKGLASRLKADTDTGEITANDPSVMLVAKKDGQVIYIPLGGTGKDPDAPNGTGNGPCDHPTDTNPDGGIDPTASDPFIGGTDPTQGGVSPDGLVHPGDSDCNECI